MARREQNSNDGRLWLALKRCRQRARTVDLGLQPDPLLAACAAQGWTPELRCEAADPAAALGLVAAGLGLAFVQQSLAPVAGGAVVLRELPASFALRMQVHCVHPGSPSPLAHRLMMVS